jgi:glycoprotein 6-alpha-L-fucosyltransferase
VLTAEVYNLSISDDIGEWRKRESIKLNNEVQNKLSQLQNPSNCEQRKKIICDLAKSCGFGCQMHHVMYCFITAYFTNRTMILESGGWRYDQRGFETYFKPISDTCKVSDDKAVGWNGIIL